MLIKILQIYYIVTISLFVSVVAKLYTQTTSFLDAYALIIESKNYFFVILNLLLALGILLFIVVQRYFLGVFQESEYVTALNNMNGFIATMAFLLYQTNINFMTFGFFYLLFSKYIITLSSVRLESMTVNTHLFTARVHRRILLLQVSLFFYCFSQIVYLLNHIGDNIINSTLLFEFFLCSENIIEGILKQYIIITDDDRGNSMQAFFFRQKVTVFCAIFLLLSFISAGIYLVRHYFDFLSDQLTILTLSLWDPVKHTIGQIFQYRKWKKLCKAIRSKLHSPTEEEVAEHETCIICRSKITANDSRKLPCGHIFHVDCMIYWFGSRQICPLCNARVPDFQEMANENQEVNENGEQTEEIQNYQFIPEPNDDLHQNDENETFGNDENKDSTIDSDSLLEQQRKNYKVYQTPMQLPEMDEDNEIKQREVNPFSILQNPRNNAELLSNENVNQYDLVNENELDRMTINDFHHPNEKKYTKEDILQEITQLKQALGGFQSRLDILQEMLIKNNDI